MTLPRACPDFIVFDLDGTLANSEAGILSSFHSTLDDRGRSVDDEVLRDLIGPPLAESFLRLGFAPSEIDDVVSIYRSYYDRDGVAMSQLYEGVEEMLLTLDDAGIVLTVATAKRVDFAERMLRGLGVDHMFQAISGATLDGRLNTKTEILGHALSQLGAQRTGGGWMVGDRHHDVTASKVHHVVSVGVTWGFGSRDELLGAGADIIITEPSQLTREVVSRLA